VEGTVIVAPFRGDAAAEVRHVLRRAFPRCRDEDLLLTNSGMNAMFTAFTASSSIQSVRGRTVWLQLGWLYRDTIAILQKFTAKPADYVYVRDPLDLDAIARIFAKFGARIAGVVAELPTNPLVQTPDLPALSQLCRRYGAHLIVDPSVASPFSVDVLDYADVVITSLTKYTASEGDLIAGLVAINPSVGDASVLRERCATLHDPLYIRDRARLAAEIGETEAVVTQIGRNTARVVAFLRSHPKVRDVFWALREDSRANYLQIARDPELTGGMITFTLREPIDPMFDRLRLPKGPSFGMKTTLACPFMYMAHFELATTPAGVAELAASRLDPDLLRMCVGTEPAEDIIAALKEALD
jgi:cystathionine gamma-synthase